ncbi:MAG: methylated-DNA--[protein]-cysteine S-methyltransferase [Gammaproteobacteria bacterium]|nr:methylated-DNA--[protein]-cysteine S-methyltransferase [Gammaproteobacteria bacterium]
MRLRRTSDYERIASAITFIAGHVNEQPTLECVARQVHLSPFHFQRLFSRWAGITPKRFLEVLTLAHAKALLGESRSCLDVAGELGLSSTSRLHDHFVTLEAVTPGQYKSGGEQLIIEYGVHETPFGTGFIAMTAKGLCDLAFIDGDDVAGHLAELQARWPRAVVRCDPGRTQTPLKRLFGGQRTWDRPLSLYVSGTNFQVRVWNALLHIPSGKLASYGQIAQAIGHPRAARAVGLAVGANPVALAIPCHRVIQSDGGLGGYRWGTVRKQAILAWEAARAAGEGNPRAPKGARRKMPR